MSPSLMLDMEPKAKVFSNAKRIMKSGMGGNQQLMSCKLTAGSASTTSGKKTVNFCVREKKYDRKGIEKLERGATKAYYFAKGNF